MSKVNSEFLTSRLKENVLAPDTNILFSRTREQELLVYFDENKTGNDMAIWFTVKTFKACKDIQDIQRHAWVSSSIIRGWRLFVDSNKRSLKCVLLYNGNEYFPVPVGHSVYL